MKILDKYIVYADDDVDDQQTLKEILRDVDSEIDLISVQDGIELLDFLNSLQPGSKFPCLLLVDMNMPRIDGIETLKLLKAHHVYSKLPVIIFSTSAPHLGVYVARLNGAEDYIKKPVKMDELRKVTQRFASHCDIVPDKEVGDN